MLPGRNNLATETRRKGTIFFSVTPWQKEKVIQRQFLSCILVGNWVSNHNRITTKHKVTAVKVH